MSFSSQTNSGGKRGSITETSSLVKQEGILGTSQSTQHSTRAHDAPYASTRIATPSKRDSASQKLIHGTSTLESPLSIDVGIDGDGSRDPILVDSPVHAVRQGPKEDLDHTTETEPEPLASWPHALALPERPREIPNAERRKERIISEKFSDAIFKTSQRQVGIIDTGQTSKQDENLGFCPWTGNTEEDELSEQSIKNGFPPKQQTLNESNTARPGLWPHIKNVSSLQALSSIFVSVQSRRREAAKISANSTFKPPPRVALTDAKKSAWLNDLANEGVPLRRLSRTIPHGIRGRDLLEACLAYKLPMHRALWLAKCVGANELRAFRRKGVSGATSKENESRWVNDWTSTLTSFVERIVENTKGEKQKADFLYALQLLSCFFNEHLLDQQQTMDWLLEHFANAPWRRIPVFTLLVNVFWRPLTSCFRNGQRLAAAFLEQSTVIEALDYKEYIIPVSLLIIRHVLALAATNLSFLLFSTNWHMIRRLIPQLFNDESSRAKALLTVVLRRNDRLHGMSPNLDHTVHKSPALRLIQTLQQLEAGESSASLYTNCCTIVPDAIQRVEIAFRWACTTYRGENWRVYVVLRLVHRMVLVHEINSESFMNALYKLEDANDLDTSALNMILIYLVRLHDFAPGVYLGWLMSTGATKGQSSTRLQNSPITSFLVDLPDPALNQSLLSVRKQLLRGTGLDEDFTRQLDSAKATLGLYAPRLFSNENIRQAAGTLETVSSSLNQRCRIALCQWIMDRVQARCLAWQCMELSEMITSREFMVTIAMTEKCGDSFHISKILMMVICCSDMEVILLVMDYLLKYLTDFTACGKLNVLIQRLIERYRFLRTQDPPCKDIVLALSEYAKRSPGEHEELVQYCKRELTIISQNMGGMVCTPASEGLFDSSQDIPRETDDEIERIFSSGTIMDAQSIEVVFETIMMRLAHAGKALSTHIWTWVDQLKRLRACGEQQFDRLMDQWLRTRLTSGPQEIGLRDIGLALIGCRCVVVDDLVNLVLQLTGDGSPKIFVDARRVAIDVLEIISANATDAAFLAVRFEDDPESAPAKTSLQAHSYFQSECRYFCMEHAQQILRLVINVLSSFSKTSSSLELERFLACCQSPLVLLSLRKAITDNPDEAIAVYMDSSEQIPSEGSTLIQYILDPKGLLPPFEQPPDVKIQALFEIANEYNLGLCRFGLIHFVRCLGGDLEMQQKLSLRIARSAAILDRPFWPELVNDLPPELNIPSLLRAHTEEAILTGPGFEHSSTADESFSEINNFYRIHLKIFQETAKTISGTNNFTTGARIIHSLTRIVNDIGSLSESVPLRTSVPTFNERARAVLHLVHAHRSSYHAEEAHAASVSKVITALCCFYARGFNVIDNETYEYLYDVLCYFIIGQSQSILHRVCQSLDPSIQHHSNIRFLLDIHENPNGWLRLTSAMQPHHNPTSFATSPDPVQEHFTPSATISLNSSQEHNISFSLQPWELLPEAMPNIGVNDTALNLKLFGARKVS